MFAHRSQRPGKGGWMPLDGAFSPDGNQIMMSTRMPADLDSMEVDGIWLMEHKEQVEGEPQAAGAGPRMSAPNRPSFLSGWLSPR
jgi:hypothetical protein